MVRSKRSRVVTLTQVKPKGASSKEALINNIREACQEYRHIIVFKVSNIRNNKLKELRQELSNCRLFMAKRKLMTLALGETEDSEIRDGVHLISKAIVGGAGIIFANEDAQPILDRLQTYEAANFPRSGFIATDEFSIKAGILEDQPFAIEPQLRKLGLSTKLDNGKVRLTQDTVVCHKGQKLTPEQCKILEIFGIEMALMHIHVIAHLDMLEGEYQEFQELDLDEDDVNEDAEEMDNDESD